jgi:hypothetical protein
MVMHIPEVEIVDILQSRQYGVALLARIIPTIFGPVYSFLLRWGHRGASVVGGRMRLFLMGMFITLTPSALVMAWLLWQAGDLGFDRESEIGSDL